MYQIGEYVVYGVHGVCRVLDDTTQVSGGKKLRYYVLEPVDQSGATYYVPAENPAALAKIRPLLDKDALDKLLASEKLRDVEWIEDENRRKQHYRELIASGDRSSVMQMVHLLHQHKALLQSQGKRLHLCDENFLRDAQKLLDSEFSLVLGLKPEEVSEYVVNALQ